MRWIALFFRKSVALPKRPEDLFRWLLIRLFFLLGGWATLGILVLILISVSFLGFLIGDFTGGGTGTVSASGQITLSSSAQLKNHALYKQADSVAQSAWQSGLSAAQIAQIQTQQVDLPGSVLLAIGKMEDNLSPFHAGSYAASLRPTYTWQTFTRTTKTWRQVAVVQKVRMKIKGHVVWRKKNVWRCQEHTVTTPMSLLVQANTWDGTLTDMYRMQDAGVSGCPVRGQVNTWTQTPVLAHSTRTYSWSRVWSLFRSMPSVASGHRRVIRDTKTNRQILAGLIAAQDDALTDPFVQQMVQVVLFPGTAVLPSFGAFHPGTASTSVVQNVLRYRRLIITDAKHYGVPAALVAAVIAQESGGREHAPGGGVLSSYVGSGGIGALGLMQVEPSTASGMYVAGAYIGASAVADLSNPVLNLRIGTKYLAELYHTFSQNAQEAESAYNAGPGGEQAALLSGYTVAQNAQTLAYVQTITSTWLPAFTAAFAAKS